MIEQNVQVLRCHGERMWVRMGSQSGCSACDEGKGCGAGLFARLLKRKPVVIELARKEMNVEAGQMLTLAFPEQAFIKLVLASYGWPLLAALTGAILGHSLSNWLQFGPAMIDLASLIGGLLAGVLAVRLIRNRTDSGFVFNSLQTTLYYRSVTPNMCSKGLQASGQDREHERGQF